MERLKNMFPYLTKGDQIELANMLSDGKIVTIYTRATPEYKSYDYIVGDESDFIGKCKDLVLIAILKPEDYSNYEKFTSCKQGGPRHLMYRPLWERESKPKAVTKYINGVMVIK